MSVDKQRKKDWDKFKISTIKRRLVYYRRDLNIIDSLADKVLEDKERMELIKSGWSSEEIVQGSGKSQDDKLNNLLDEIRECERNLKLIELENRALTTAIVSLSDPDMVKIIFDKWVYDRKSIEVLAGELHISAPTCWRWSNKALIEIYDKLYILTPSEIDRR
ncbi:hypothetical protein [Anaerococcus nagyae]|uniref:hypothetical protein n=1 Tax=Anaerococcus nagyae TaxID=1755241 RepID=UPI00324E2008